MGRPGDEMDRQTDRPLQTGCCSLSPHFQHMVVSGPRKPCLVLRGAGKRAAPWRSLSFCFLPPVASPNLGFAYLSGGGEARPLPGLDPFGPLGRVGGIDQVLSAPCLT